MSLLSQVLFLCCFYATSVFASVISLQSKEPLHIKAKHGIRCNDKERFCVANGDIVANQGRFTLSCEQLTVYYDNNRQFVSLKAEGRVMIDPNDTQKAYGDTVYYEGETQKATFTGNAKFFESHLLRTLRGDQVTVHLEENQKGELIASRVDGEGNIILTTDKEVIRGQKGLYLKNENKAYITEQVKITQKESQHNGEYAIANFDTGITELFAHMPGQAPEDPDHKKVVEILFYPKDRKKE